MTAPQLTVSLPGTGVVTADLLNTYTQSCDTFVQLRNFVGTQGIMTFARGQSTINDGLGGFFYWNSTSTATDDNFNYINPTGNLTGRWIRVTYYTSAVNPYPFATPQDNLTAYPGGGRTNATAITAASGKISLARVATAVYTGDSVILGGSITAPAIVILMNNTSVALQVFGSNSDTINGYAATVGISVPPQSVSVFIQFTSNAWQVGTYFV